LQIRYLRRPICSTILAGKLYSWGRRTPYGPGGPLWSRTNPRRPPMAPDATFHSIFMLYTNQITKIKKNIFWLYQTISEAAHGGDLGTKVKHFYFSPLPTNFFLISIFTYQIVLVTWTKIIQKDSCFVFFKLF
jgi:hypothetical protein